MFQHSYVDQTVLNPLGLLALIVLGIVILLVPRRYAVVPMIIMACFIAPAQRIYVVGANFTLLRLIVIFGWVRVISRRETREFRWCILDYLLIAYVVCGTLIYVIQNGTTASLIYKLGESYDAVGLYFLFRWLVRDWLDIDAIAKAFAIVSLPVLVAFVIEHATGHNLFAFLGGVPAITVIRDGRLRCQGAFAQPILAGTFWAAVIPLMAAEWWRKKMSRFWICVGIAASLGIIILCSSSGPVAAIMLAIVAGCFFPLRRKMRLVLWAVFCLAVATQLAMQNPIWHLLDRIDLVGGSTGWYRYFLIDEAVKHIGEWWLAGIQSTRNWGAERGYPIYDITNQYILEGIRGGIWTLGIFIAMIIVAFRYVGVLWRSVADDKGKVAMAWALGVCLFVHVTSFISVSYFGQIIMVWYLTLATIGSLYRGIGNKPMSARQYHRRRIVSRSPQAESGMAVSTGAINVRT